MSISLLGRTCKYAHLDGHVVSIVRQTPVIVWPISAPSEPLTLEHRLRCEVMLYSSMDRSQGPTSRGVVLQFACPVQPCRSLARSTDLSSGE